MKRLVFLGSAACLAIACATTSLGRLAAPPPPSPAQEALDAGNLLEAAALFSHTCRQNPLQHMADCLQAGMLWTELQRWEEAERVLKPIANPQGEGASLEACFPLAISHYERGQLEAVAALLKPIAERSTLDNRWRLRAQTEYAICLLEQGKHDEAERLLEAVVDTALPPADELEKATWAKAKFFLAEIAFLRFAESSFCDRCSVNLMAKDVERKAQLLLDAQELFLQTIQAQNNYWGIAAGMRIGELYETLYQQLLASPLPLEINPEGHASYRKEMRKLLRSLLGKALQNYEDTLHTAERIGATGFFAKRTRERLLHLTQQLLDGAEETR
jgi:tetratricopeptide (TPR) repeat protein